MKTKTQVRTAPAVALRRVAVVAAVLLTLCLVFMMPVGAADEISWVEVSSFDDLKSNLIAGNSVRLDADITGLWTNNGESGWLIVVPTDKTATLDLNGHKIEVTDNYNDGATGATNSGFLKVNGKLTIKDSTSSEGSITVTLDVTRSDALSCVISCEGGEVIIESGTLEWKKGKGSCLIGDVVDVNTTLGDAKLTVTGTAHLKSEGMGVRGFANSISSTSIEISGGTIISEKRSVYFQSFSGTTDLVISKGEVISNEMAIYILHSDTDITSSFTMTGGSLESKSASYPVLGLNAHSVKVMINDGNFIASSAIITDWMSKAVITLNGGKYNKIPEDYIPEKYYAQMNEDGTYTVKNTCDVTFDSDGGSAVEAIRVSYTDTVTEPTAPTKEGYTFDGWYLDGEPYGFTTLVTEDITLKAQWTINQYTITFTDDGSEITSIKQDYGTEVNAPVAPTKEGYEFAGWSPAIPETMPAEDLTINALWKQVFEEGGEIVPEISVEITVDKEGTATIPITSKENTVVAVSDDKKSATITDASTGVQMEVKFTAEVTPTDSGNLVVGTVKEVSVSYPETPAESDAVAESDEAAVKQEVSFSMGTVMTELPTISSEKVPAVEEKVKKQEQRANVLAMITATHDKLNELNTNITKVTITFKVHASLISNSDFVKAYHVHGDNVEPLSKANINIDGPVEGYYIITITKEGENAGFSSYVLVEEEPEQYTGGGSATDTGSGNYQYYPRSVPTDGIISFGTSKVVTGMELPAGSDGTVTLNIKPTFAMPENGFYAFEIDAPGYNLDAKINGGLSFQIPVADLEAAGWTAEDIVLFHGTVAEDGKITWEALPTNLVKNENGVAYYKAAINGCSPFYIGFVKDGSVVNTEAVDPTVPETPEQPVTPDEPEILPPVEEPTEEPETPASPAPILAVFAGLGAVVALRRK